MGTVIAVTSGKGGTGKTSITGGVAASLALMGHTVLCIDMDIGLRNLDITLGLSDRALMDFSDVALGRCPLARGAVDHPDVKGLSLLTAPMSLSPSLTIDKGPAFGWPSAEPTELWSSLPMMPPLCGTPSVQSASWRVSARST